MKTKNEVYRFKIYLKGIKPMIWRRIELKGESTFWDLTSAILDAMGWLGYHLFEFEVKEPGSGFKQLLGAPSNDYESPEDLIPVWEVKISDYFTMENNKCLFTYDFGDDWQHVVRLEAVHEEDENTSYPVCLAGKRACPPEDCGGISGYYDLIETLQNPGSEEYEELLDWLGGAYDPAEFNKDDVVFEDAVERLKEYGGPALPTANNQDSVNSKSAKKTNAVGKNLSLKQGLSNLLKDELVFLAKHQGITEPNKIKKADLIKLLGQIIPQKFVEDMIYLTPEEVLVFTNGFKGLFPGIDIDEMLLESKKEKDLDISLNEMLETLDQIQDEILNKSPRIVDYLIDKGYVFFKGKYYDGGIEVPQEIKTIYLKEFQNRGKELNVYRMLQMYILAMINLYGVCTYNQLHKVFNKHSGSKLSLKKIKDYVVKFAEKSIYYKAEDNYFYTTDLGKADYETIVDSDLKRDYYFPSEEEIMFYGCSLSVPEAEDIYNNMTQIILEKTRIVDLNSHELISYEDAVDLETEEILDEYDFILSELVIYAKMGKGLYDLIDTLDLSMCKFTNLKDMNQLYVLFLDLLEKTRKWPLKGALYSDLRKDLKQ